MGVNTNRCFAVWFLIHLPSGIAFAAGTPNRPPDVQVLTVSDRGELRTLQLVVRELSSVETVSVPRLLGRLRERIRKTRELRALGIGYSESGHEYFALAAAADSNDSNRGGLGHCGAGSEESLWLVERTAKKNTLRLSDSLLVQSCLNSLALTGDAEVGFNEWVAGIEASRAIELQWLNHPLYGDNRRQIVVRAGRWSVR